MSLQITELRIIDFKKLRAVHIDPETGDEIKPVVLTGTNGAGKSAVLDAIEWGLTRKGTEQPVRRGSKKAIVEMVISNENRKFSLRRSETSKGTHDFQVADILEPEDGKPVPSPQGFISGLLASSIAFDPLAFLALKPKERVEALKGALGLDFTDLEAKKQAAYDERTGVNRDGKNLAERFAVLHPPAEGLPEEEENVADLVAERDEIRLKIERVDEIEGELQGAEVAVKATLTELEALKKRLAEEEADVTEKKEALKKATAEAPTPEALEALNEKIGKVDSTNAAVRAAREYVKMKAELEAKRAESAKLTKTIETLDAKKREMIETAKFPVDGMEILEDDVYVGGVPFTQLSTGEQVVVSSEVAMAENPDLPLVLVREGALVSRANLALLFERVSKRGFMLFLEKFQEEPSAEGLHIEDGTVAYKDGKPVDPPAEVEEPEEEEPPAAAEAPAKKAASSKKDKGSREDEALNLSSE